MKKLLITAIFFIILILLGLYHQLASEIIESENIYEFRNNFGYEIGKRSYRNGAWLKIWNSRGFDFSYYDSQMTINEIVEKRWIDKNRAIYMKLAVGVFDGDSYTQRDTAQILYDFQRCELYVASRAPLWRIKDNSENNKAWMTEDEFQNILTELEK